jgi:hypothetical protein
MNSKRIGSNYERDIARILSQWFTGNKDELVVWRSVSSGSIATIRKKKGLNQNNLEGDFQCLDLKYQPFFDTFYLDSKSLSKINLFTTNPKNEKSNQLLSEWKKVLKDSGDKFAIMIVKIRGDRTIPDFVMLQEDIIVKCNNCIHYMFKDPKFNALIITQEEFFKYNKWNTFLEKNKKIQ